MKRWIKILCDELAVYHCLLPVTYIGSGNSNHICLSAKEVPPLCLQIIVSEGELYTVRDFAKSAAYSVRLGERFHFADFEAQLFSDETLITEAYPSIAEGFRNFLAQSGRLNDSQTLADYCQLIFPRDDVPQELLRCLSQQQQELTLQSAIEDLLSSESVTDILVKDGLDVSYEENGVLHRSSQRFILKEDFSIYLQNLLSQHGKSLNEFSPLSEFSNRNGVRYHVIGPPLTDGSIYLSIRKPRFSLRTLCDLEREGMISSQLMLHLERALTDRLNVLIVGSTGSGKTTLLRALLQAIPSNERIVTIEDTPELQVERPAAAFLRTRSLMGNDVSMQDLLRESLRMRPDRLVLGEVRGKEAFDLLSAMNTGHRGCLGSLHANSCRDGLYRLLGLCQFADRNLSEEFLEDLIARNLHLILFCEKIGRIRRVVQWAYVRGRNNRQFLLEEHAI